MASSHQDSKQLVQFSVLAEDQTFANREGMMYHTYQGYLTSGPDKDGYFMIEAINISGRSEMFRVHSTSIKIVPKKKQELTFEQKNHQEVLASLI